MEPAKPRHSLAIEKGGMQVYDTDKVVKKAIYSGISLLGAKLLEGNIDLWSITTPPEIHYPITSLEIISNDLVYSDKYLVPAAKCEDPILKMKYVVAMMIAG